KMPIMTKEPRCASVWQARRTACSRGPGMLPGISKRVLCHAWPLTLVLLAGCSYGTGRSLFFSTSHRLIPQVADVRQPVAPDVPRDLEKQPLPTYIVEPGDVLLVYPADLDSPVRLPGDQPVLLDGTIDLGRYGRLVVAGKPLDVIEALVRAAVAAQTP